MTFLQKQNYNYPFKLLNIYSTPLMYSYAFYK